MSRVVSLSQLLLAKRLDVRAALPAAPRHLPDLDLSETAHRLLRSVLKSVATQPPATFRALRDLFARAGGQPRRWRLR